MTQFDKDYKHGKESEIKSLPDLQDVFGKDLILDDEMFAHFDYFKDDYMCELKTRDDIVFKDNEFHYTTRKGKKMILDSIYFDAVKMRFAFQYNKKNKEKKRFFIIWKCNNEYFYWEMNWKGEKGNREEYFIEEINGDFGHGYKQVRDVINVRVEFIKRLSTLSL